MFEKIKQIIKDKYGDKADLYDTNDPEFDSSNLQIVEDKEPWVSPYLNGTFPMPKSKRPSVGRTGKSNRKRQATNAKLKRRRAV